MWKKILILGFLCLLGATTPTIRPVSELPYWETPERHGAPGWEERGEEYIKWLAPSVRVTAWPDGGGGSGTICYIDEENWIYVITCGHLYPATYRSAAYYQTNPNYKNVTVYYHNEKKLDKPKSYKAETLCSVYDGVYDVALIRFKGDWTPEWVIPIAPADYKLEKGKYYHSLGCDGLKPVAHYLVKYQHSQTHQRNQGEVVEHVTTENGPRKGRSGGGVMTDDLQLIMICSRGNSKNGFWSSTQQIHKFLTKEGFKPVLDGMSLANKIPIIDRNNPQGKYPKDYIPVPRK